jgi:hypothetical protein
MAAVAQHVAAVAVQHVVVAAASIARAEPE